MLTNLPNLLTLFRIACIPVLVALFFIPAGWAPWAACAVFVAAAVTDYFDGLLARRLDQVSGLGKLLDPIADKMLVAATLLLLVAFDRLGGLSILPALIILLREILVSGLREYLAGLKADSLPVSALAKWKTAVQMTALGFLIVGDAGPAAVPVLAIGVAGLWLASLLTLVTGWDYLTRGMRAMADEPRAEDRPSRIKAARSIG